MRSGIATDEFYKDPVLRCRESRPTPSCCMDYSVLDLYSVCHLKRVITRLSSRACA